MQISGHTELPALKLENTLEITACLAHDNQAERVSAEVEPVLATSFNLFNLSGSVLMALTPLRVQSDEALQAWWVENTTAFKPRTPRATSASKKNIKSAKKEQQAAKPERARSSVDAQGCGRGHSPLCSSRTPLAVATRTSRPVRAATLKRPRYTEDADMTDLEAASNDGLPAGEGESVRGCDGMPGVSRSSPACDDA